MSQNAVLTQGTKLYYSTDGVAFTAVPEIISISGPDATKSEIRASDLDSLAEEYLGGLADFGRMSVEIYYRATLAIHAALFADFKDPTSPVRFWRQDFVNGKKWSFNASIFAFPLNVQPNDTVKATLTLRLSGTVTET